MDKYAKPYSGFKCTNKRMPERRFYMGNVPARPQVQGTANLWNSSRYGSYSDGDAESWDRGSNSVSVDLFSRLNSFSRVVRDPNNPAKIMAAGSTTVRKDFDGPSPYRLSLCVLSRRENDTPLKVIDCKIPVSRFKAAEIIRICLDEIDNLVDENDICPYEEQQAIHTGFENY